jgi:hypothetical protein
MAKKEAILVLLLFLHLLLFLQQQPHRRPARLPHRPKAPKAPRVERETSLKTILFRVASIHVQPFNSDYAQFVCELLHAEECMLHM